MADGQGGGESNSLGRRVTRRRFLTAAGGATAGVLWQLGQAEQATRLAGRLIGSAATVDTTAAEGLPVGELTQQPSVVTRTLRRSTDQLQLQLSFHNWRLVRSGGRSLLTRQDSNAPVVVTFPSQAFGEETHTPQTADFSVPAPGGTRARIAQRSRLVFDLPSSITTLPANDNEALLDWRTWALRVVPHARASAPQPGEAVRRPRAPRSTETALELPWFLILSPNERSTFLASPTAVVDAGVAEVWHARMATRFFSLDGQPSLSERRSSLRSVRAVWARDQGMTGYLTNPDNAPEAEVGQAGYPFHMPMTPQQRAKLVLQTSGYGFSSTPPQRVPVEKLALGALGATLDLGVRFTNPAYGLEFWRHRMNLGRDHFVRIVETGFLGPWGFPAARFIVTERSIHSSTGGAVAALIKRQYVVVRDPDVRYVATSDGPADIGLPVAGRFLPFQSARIATLISPELAPDDVTLGSSLALKLLRADGQPAIFDVVATDIQGHQIDLAMPLVFVPDDANKVEAQAMAVRNAWNADAVSIAVGGQRLAFAPEVVDGSCTLPAVRMQLNLDPATNAQFVAANRIGPDHQNLAPFLAHADVALDGVRAVSGASAQGISRIAFNGRYLNNGFEAGEVWARIVDGVDGLDFSADRSGGVITPGLQLRALSRKLGAVGGTPDTVATGSFQPGDWFETGSATLLGGIDLIDVVVAITDFGGAGAPGPDTVPQLVTEQLPNALEHRYIWRPRLQADQPLRIFEPLGDKRAEIITTVRMSAGGGGPLTDVRGELGPAKLHLPSKAAPLLTLPFDRLAFNARAGQRPDVDVEIDTDGIKFGGELDFIRGVKRYLAFGGGSGPTVEVTDDAIAVDVSAQLPDVKLGVFSLYDLDFSGGIEIPLDGSPVLVRFGLGTQSNPFHLTVFGLGGGGFFEIALTSKGLQRMTLGLEACAEVTLDFGLFSAGIGCAFGCVITLTLDDNDDPELGFVAYFRMWGEIDLAIASASISLYLGLEYTPAGDLYGRAVLVVEITVLFFSESVEIEFERRFSSCDNDPPFAAYLSAGQWRDDYCVAFAPLAVVGSDDDGGIFGGGH